MRSWSFLQRFSLSNLQEVHLLGSLPDELGLREKLSRGGSFLPLSTQPRLIDRIRRDCPRVMVTLVGVGTRGGFVTADASDTQRQVLPETWWRVDGFDLELFAFSCHSAEYLRGSDIAKRMKGSLCYEGNIWLWGGEAGYWARLITRIRKRLRRLEHVGNEAVASVELLYAKAILGRPWWRKKPSYLSQICLVKQAESVRLVRGGDI